MLCEECPSGGLQDWSHSTGGFKDGFYSSVISCSNLDTCNQEEHNVHESTDSDQAIKRRSFFSKLSGSGRPFLSYHISVFFCDIYETNLTAYQLQI